MQLADEHGISLRRFEVLAALRDAGGAMRVNQLCADLGEIASSLSRRLDRLEDDGLVMRQAAPAEQDGRAVTVTITREGRLVWRDANITFRRMLQRHFAQS